MNALCLPIFDIRLITIWIVVRTIFGGPLALEVSARSTIEIHITSQFTEVFIGSLCLYV